MKSNACSFVAIKICLMIVLLYEFVIIIIAIGLVHNDQLKLERSPDHLNASVHNKTTSSNDPKSTKEAIIFVFVVHLFVLVIAEIATFAESYGALKWTCFLNMVFMIFDVCITTYDPVWQVIFWSTTPFLFLHYVFFGCVYFAYKSRDESSL